MHEPFTSQKQRKHERESRRKLPVEVEASGGIKTKEEALEKIKLGVKRIGTSSAKAISEGIKEFYRTHNHPSKGLKGVLSPQYGIGGKYVFCYNKGGEELIFPSINATRQHFKVRWTYIKKNIDSEQWITLAEQSWIIQSIPRFPSADNRPEYEK